MNDTSDGKLGLQSPQVHQIAAHFAGSGALKASADVLAGLFIERLAECKKLWDSALPNQFSAVPYAAELCRLYGQPPPVWLVDAAFDVVGERMTPEEKQRRRWDRIHYIRWDAVTQLRKESGMTWEWCRAAVSEYLQDTEARGDVETIWASYKLVQKEFKEGRGSRFLIVDRRTDEALDL